MHAVIQNVAEESAAHEAGLEKGDVILTVNSNPVQDVIDYMYYSRDDLIDLKIQRGSKTLKFQIKKKDRKDPGFELKPFRVRTCRNKCIFCFVHQLPKGMRKTLYLRDDDYRMSFLYGNYITLTNLNPSVKKRIFAQRLQPLYVSVHSTNNEIRRKMLGNPKAPDILNEIKELTSHRIKIHSQVVLCPGINDGEELVRTIKDLQKFYPYIVSIAVVPVGLTKYRKGSLRAVEKPDAEKVIESVYKLRRRFRKRHGDPLVYLADEFYIKAGAPFPSTREYGDFPQIENGVGMVPYFQNLMKKVKIPKKIEPLSAAVFTGAAFMPYLEEFIQRLNELEGLTLDLFKVENRLFGQTVTVAGLLSGRDILKTIVGKSKADCLLVPDVVLRDSKDVFLDNVTLKDMEESLGMRVMVIGSTPAGLIKGLRDAGKREN
jgi:putative radical SAM enzyme (TIGR03279 family)